MFYFFFNTVKPRTIAINQKAKKITNIILATDAAPAATPVKPKMPATSAIIKNIAAHLNIKKVLNCYEIIVPENGNNYYKTKAVPFL